METADSSNTPKSPIKYEKRSSQESPKSPVRSGQNSSERSPETPVRRREESPGESPKSPANCEKNLTEKTPIKLGENPTEKTPIKLGENPTEKTPIKLGENSTEKTPVKCGENSTEKSSVSEEHNQTEEYTYDEQCDMISFLIETNRISSCCSLPIWRLMAIKRSKRPPESLLEQFKSEIAPEITQFLQKLGLIELPGVLKEFRLALNQKQINENESSASLSVTPSTSSITRELQREDRKRKRAPTPDIILQNKLTQTVKIEPAPSTSANGDDSLHTSMEEGTYDNEITIDDSDDSDCFVELIKVAGNVKAKKLKKSTSAGSNDVLENDDELSDYLVGVSVWERMYGPITLQKRKPSQRIQFPENSVKSRSRGLKSSEFSIELLTALEHSKCSSSGKAYCIEEELAMLHYFICKPIEIQYCRGKNTFKNIQRENWNILKDRTWEAMRKRFNDYIIGYIDRFGLPEKILNEFLYWEWYRQSNKEATGLNIMRQNVMSQKQT